AKSTATPPVLRACGPAKPPVARPPPRGSRRSRAAACHKTDFHLLLFLPRPVRRGEGRGEGQSSTRMFRPHFSPLIPPCNSAAASRRLFSPRRRDNSQLFPRNR